MSIICIAVHSPQCAMKFLKDDYRNLVGGLQESFLTQLRWILGALRKEFGTLKELIEGHNAGGRMSLEKREGKEANGSMLCSHTKSSGFYPMSHEKGAE